MGGYLNVFTEFTTGWETLLWCAVNLLGGATHGRIISALSMYFTVCIPQWEPCHVFQYFDCMRRLYLHNAKLKSN